VAQGEPDLTLRRLLASTQVASIAELTAELEREARARPVVAERPHVAVNMIASVDGRAAIRARSGGLSAAADRAVFHALRALADAVLVGAGTARSERYGRMIRDPATRRAREQAGRSAEPLACIVSARLALDATLPLLSEPEARVVIVTASERSLPAVPASVEYVRAATPDHALDIPAALRGLHERFGARDVLCEGGPSLNADLFAAGAVDELFLSLAPTVAGGDDPLRIVGPSAALQPVSLELVGAFLVDSFLFLHYRVGDTHALP